MPLLWLVSSWLKCWFIELGIPLLWAAFSAAFLFSQCWHCVTHTGLARSPCALHHTYLKRHSWWSPGLRTIQFTHQRSYRYLIDHFQTASSQSSAWILIAFWICAALPILCQCGSIGLYIYEIRCAYVEFSNHLHVKISLNAYHTVSEW